MNLAATATSRWSRAQPAFNVPLREEHLARRPTTAYDNYFDVNVRTTIRKGQFWLVPRFSQIRFNPEANRRMGSMRPISWQVGKAGRNQESRARLRRSAGTSICRSAIRWRFPATVTRRIDGHCSPKPRAESQPRDRRLQLLFAWRQEHRSEEASGKVVVPPRFCLCFAALSEIGEPKISLRHKDHGLPATAYLPPGLKTWREFNWVEVERWDQLNLRIWQRRLRGSAPIHGWGRCHWVCRCSRQRECCGCRIRRKRALVDSHKRLRSLMRCAPILQFRTPHSALVRPKHDGQQLPAVLSSTP